MATRKSEDGSRSADVGSERPGSYAKVSGSRRRRKRRGTTSLPPASSMPSDEPRIVDTVADADEGRISDLGSGAVDDLRRASRPSSSRPRNELGPLGMEDIRAEPPAKPVGSDRPRGLTVVEMDGSEPLDPFGDEITTQSPASRLFDEEDVDPVAEHDRELAREYELDGLVPGLSEARGSLPPRRSRADELRASTERDVLARLDDYDVQDARQSLSSVLGARPSLRPSPRPEKPRDSASALWWLVVAALVAIIAAAGAIAAREQFASEDEPEPTAPATVHAPAPERTSIEASRPRAVSFGTPQTTVVSPPTRLEPANLPKGEPQKPDLAPRTPASPSLPSVVPAAQSAAARAGAPYTSAVTGAASATSPSASGPGASAVPPGEGKAKVNKSAGIEASGNAERPSANYAPGYGKTIAETSYAPGDSAAVGKPALRPGPDATRGKPNLAPASESRDNELPGLPINPYD